MKIEEKNITKLIGIILLIILTSLNLQAQFFSIGRHPGCNASETESKAADNQIERNIERYSVFKGFNVQSWYARGGTVIGSGNTVYVEWEQDAAEYYIRVSGTQSDGTSYSYQRNLTKDYDIDNTITQGVIGSNNEFCANERISYSGAIKINADEPVHDSTYIEIRWRLKDVNGNVVINELGIAKNMDDTISNSGYFVPNNIGVPPGEYDLVAEFWRYYVCIKGGGTPYSYELYDRVPYTETVSRIVIYDAAPKVDVMQFVEKVANRNTKETSIGITSFTYGGTTYTYNGVDSTANWPSGIEFVVTAVTNNPSVDEDDPEYNNPGFNFLKQENIPNWNRLISKICESNGDLPSQLDELEMKFEFIEGEGENACAWEGTYNIPVSSYSTSKPTCSSVNNGQIIVNSGNHDAWYPIIYYKLYRCTFDSEGEITGKIQHTPPVYARGNYSTIFDNLPSGEYIIRTEKYPYGTEIHPFSGQPTNPPNFIIEDYIDLTAYRMRITDLDSFAPSCYEGVNGSFRINSFEYNSDTFNSDNNSLPNVQAVITDQWPTYWPIGGTFVFPQTLTGAPPYNLSSGTYQLRIAVDDCLSEPYELIIPPRNQNTLKLDSVRPTCYGYSDGNILATSITHNDITYPTADEDILNGVTFNVYPNNSTLTPTFSTSSLNIDLVGNYAIPHPSNNFTGGTSYWVSYTKDNCESERIEIEIPVGPTFSIDTLPNQTITPATCFEGPASITINDFSWDGASFSDSTLTNFTFSFSEPNPPSAPTSFPFTFPVHGGENWSFQISNSLCSSDVMVFPTIPHPAMVNIPSPRADSVRCYDESNGSITVAASDGNTASNMRYFTISPDVNEVGTLAANSGQSVTFEDLPSSENLLGGGYWVTVTDGCIVNNSTQVEVTVSNYPEITATMDSLQMRCHNEYSGQLFVTASGGIANYNIILLPDNDTIYNIAEDTQQSFTGLNDFTSYNIQIDDVNGCTNTFLAPGIVNPAPLLIVSDEVEISNVTCWNGSDASISLGVSGGTGQVGFSLDTANFVPGTFNDPHYSHTFMGLNAGNTTVYVEDVNHCRISQEYTIIQPQEYLISEFQINGTQCYGGSDGGISITATGGTPDENNYRYYLVEETSGVVDSIIGVSAEFTELPYGNYYIDIFDVHNCPLTSSINELSQPALMDIEPLMTSASCYDAENITITADVSGGTGPYSYTWQGIDNNIIATGTNTIDVASGIFYVNVVDANNCGYRRTAPNLPPFSYQFIADMPDTIKLNIDLQLNVDYHDLSNGSVLLASTGGWSFHQYSMNGTDFQNASIFSGLSEGYHNFWVQDRSGCRDSLTTYISQPDVFSADLGPVSDVNCYQGTDGQVTINAQGGIPPYTFTLDDGMENIFSQEINIFDSLPTGNYTASISYTGNNPSTPYVITLNDIVVNQPESALSSSITDYQYPNCTQSDGWATVTTSGGTAPYSYLWDNSQSLTTATNLASGLHYIVVNDDNNCADTSWITLFNIGGPELAVSQINGLRCSYSENEGNISLSVSGGTEPYVVQWDDPENQTGLTASNLNLGTYSATVTDANSCISILENLEITSPDELLISFDDFKDPTCYNDTNGVITASGTGGTPPYYFNWQGIEATGNTGIASGLSAGTYNLVLIDDNDCADSSSFELRNPEQINIDLQDSVFICQGQIATLDAGNMGSLYQWSSDNGFSSDQQIVDIQQEGSYSVTVSNIEGCSNTKQVVIKHENRLLDAGFLLASEASMNDTIVLVEISWPVPDSLVWDIPSDFSRLTDGQAYKELLPLQTGEYTIGVKAYMAGCQDIVEKTITIVPADSQKSKNKVAESLIQEAKLYPNPNSGVFEIEVKLAYESDIRADVFSMKGMRMIPTKYDYGKKEYLLGFNLLRLQPGVYFVNIYVENEMKKLKFVVN